MKRLICMSIALLFIAWCAFAAAQEIAESDITTPRAGVAVAAPQNPEAGGTVPMYEKPDTNSRVLMAYYSGAQMEVLGILGDMVQVQCGVEGASIMGYMRTQDLRYGALAMREVPRCFKRYAIKPLSDIYAYCDGRSGVIMQTEEAVQIEVYGENDDGWGQLLPLVVVQTGAWMRYTPDRGFICLGACSEGLLVVQEGERLVLPADGEMTYEAARARAIEFLLETHDMEGKIDERYRSREALEAFWSDVRLYYDPQTDMTSWQVFLQAEEDHSQNFTIYMDVNGEPEEINKGNG